MMKVEIKKIPVLSVLFSAFPVAVFVVMLVGALLEMFNPALSLGLGYVMSAVLMAIKGTLLFLVSAVFFVWGYNVLCALGIRGVQVELEDK